MKRLFYISIAALVLGVASPSWAAEWKMDPLHSAVQFEIKHIFSTVFGRFSDFDGAMVFDPDNLEKSRFDFTVQVASVDTDNTKRDNHLRSKDFFAADEFPAMRFVSSAVTHKGGDTYLVRGTMTIKETSTEMEIPFVFHGVTPSPFKKSQMVAGFDTEFSLDRLAFGVGNGKFYKMGVVGKTVQVRISVEALGS